MNTLHVPRSIATHILGACVMDPVPAGNTPRTRPTGKTGGRAAARPSRPRNPAPSRSSTSRTILAKAAPSATAGCTANAELPTPAHAWVTRGAEESTRTCQNHRKLRLIAVSSQDQPESESSKRRF